MHNYTNTMQPVYYCDIDHTIDKALFFMKKTKVAKNLQAMYEHGIPVIDGGNLDELMKNYERSIKNYTYQVFNAQYI